MAVNDNIDQAHLAAIPVLLQPLIRTKEGHGDITAAEASQILYDWDQARKAENKT